MGKKLYVGSLPYEITEDQLHVMFSACGQVVSVQLITDRDTGRSKGFGFVEMSTEDEAKAAIQKLNGTASGTRTLVVNEARPQEKRPGGGGGGFGGGRGGYGGGRGGYGGGGGRRGGGGGGGGGRW